MRGRGVAREGRLITFIALLALASPAESRLRYISPIGADSLSTGETGGARGTTALKPWRTFATAIEGMQAGLDTLIMAASTLHSSGSYADGIVPAANTWRSYAGLTFIGDSIDCRNVYIPSISVSAGQGQIQMGDMRIIGVRTRSVYVKESPCCGNADGFTMRRFLVNGSFEVVDTRIHLSSGRIGVSKDTSCYFRNTATTETTRGTTLDSVTVNATPGSVAANYYTDYMISFQVDRAPQIRNEDWTVTNCAFNFFKPDAYDPGKCSIFRSLYGCRFIDNVWTYSDSSGLTAAGTGTEGQGILFRDNLWNNLWLRDQFNMLTRRAGTGKGFLDFTSPGERVQGGNNKWRYLVVKSTIPLAAAIRFGWQLQPGDSFTRCIVVDSTAVSRSGFFVNNIKGTPSLYRNTFAHLGSAGGALMLSDTASDTSSNSTCLFWNSALSLEGNIVYTGQTGTGATDYAGAYKFPVIVNSPTLDGDFNLYGHFGGSGGNRSIWADRCGVGYADAVYTPAAFYAAYGSEAASVYGSPRFVDSTFSGFNANIRDNSAARGILPGGLDAGAMDFDLIRPDEVADLGARGSSSSAMLLQWTATGDDSLTGMATTYDIRYSTSAITEANWALATAVTGEPTPATAGTLEDMIVTGLASSTHYFFAMKVTDKAGNPSALSNVTDGETRPSGAPDIIEP